jgi:transcriptional regulator with XRE-family HTH domain
VNEAQVIELIKQRANEAGSQKALAQELGVSEPYLSDVLKGRRSPSENLLNRLGIRKVVEFFQEGEDGN